MQQLAQQLERVRRISRWMLIGQRLSQWLVGLIVAVLLLAVVDYVLRLPSYLRLGIGIAAAAAAAVWLAGRLRRAGTFSPTLDQLALRLERLHPQLAGSLAAAVEFTVHGDRYRQPRHTADLVATTLADVRHRAESIDARVLLDTTRTVRLAVLLLGALLVLGGVVAVVPDHSAIAAHRWFAPLGAPAWPKRTQVQAAVAESVWPADTPLRFAATVERGYESGLRVEARYRIIDPNGRVTDWQSPLMSEQLTADEAAPLFERQVELPETLVRTLQEAGESATVEYSFAAGDDQTPVQRLTVVARPRVTGVRVAIDPPAYAEDLVGAQTVDLFAQGGQTPTVSVLQGSKVSLDATFNKSTARLADDRPMTFVLDRSVEFPFRLIDEHGLRNLSERRYRIEAIQDKPPTVSLVQPAVDESVLPSATVDLRALAQDDLAAAHVAIEAKVESQRGTGDPDGAGEVDESSDASDASAKAAILAERSGRGGELSVRHGLELSSLSVQRGDVVVLTGVARDVFELDGRRHDPVRSSPRRLRIIDEATLIQQLRTELAALRQQAVRAEQFQRELVEDRPDRAEADQAQLTRRIEAQRSLVRSLMDRAERNRLDEPAMAQLMQQTDALAGEAADASRAAQQTLEQTEDPRRHDAAAEDQQRAVDRLGELVSLLDQGRDAISLQLKLRQLEAAQANLAEQARQLFPKTAGQDVENLPQALREALRELAEAQRQAAEQAGEMARQMQETARNLSQQDDARSRAAAEALAEAAAIAQRQGLEQSMRRAADAADENQLSQAAGDQSQSLDTLSQMLEEMGTQQQRMMAMLRRRLRELVETIEQLIERQQGEIAALDAAADVDALPALEPPQSALRRATMAAQERARTPQTESVALHLNEAVDGQGQAVVSLRERQRPGAKQAETGALAALEAALAQARELEQDAADEAAREQRAELKSRYEKLAEEQLALREAASPLAGLDAPTRRQRAELVDLGHQQSDLRAAVEALRDEVGDTLVFRHLHGRIDEMAGTVTDQLRRGEADRSTLSDQQGIASMLRQMAAALDEQPQDEPFAGQQQGGGGGGGAGGEMPPIVPPVAELKLLRGMQEAIYDQTRSLNEAGGAAGDGEAAMIELSARQRELAGLGERLMERVRQNQPPPGQGQ